MHEHAPMRRIPMLDLNVVATVFLHTARVQVGWNPPTESYSVAVKLRPIDPDRPMALVEAGHVRAAVDEFCRPDGMLKRATRDAHHVGVDGDGNGISTWILERI